MKRLYEPTWPMRASGNQRSRVDKQLRPVFLEEAKGVWTHEVRNCPVRTPYDQVATEDMNMQIDVDSSEVLMTYHQGGTWKMDGSA